MEAEEVDDNEVTLVLLEERIKAQKDKLSRHSQYFAALFSNNFKDHEQKEFEVRYEISPITLKAFVSWCCNDGEHGESVHSSEYHFDVKISLQQFLTEHRSELLELLNISVLFSAEKLIDDVTEMIICLRLHPEEMLEFWLLSEELELKVLRDIAFSVCLDRFEEISLSCLLKLSEEVFFKLVNNMNIRCSSDHILFVIKAWMNRDNKPEECLLENQREAPIGGGNLKNGFHTYDWYFKVKKTKTPMDPNKLKTSDASCLKSVYESIQPQFMPCAAGRKVDNSLFVWAWNDDKCEIEELAQITDMQMLTRVVSNGKELVGRQVTGRGFSIYVIGGEQGLGTGRFNTTLWRYCLISKKWYIETILPRPRRHMAVGFLKNKLYLFGGVGRHRLKLSSVDVYDIHKGIWSEAPKIPETFTEVPPSCVTDGKFVYNKSSAYIYDPNINRWQSFILKRSEYYGRINQPLLLSETLTKKIFIVNSEKAGYEPSLAIIIHKSFLEPCPDSLLINHRCIWPPRYARTEWNLYDDTHMIYQQIWSDPLLVSFGYKNDEPYVEVGQSLATRIPPSNILPYNSEHWLNKEPKDKARDCFKNRLGCFNVIDPNTLHRPIYSVIFELCSNKQSAESTCCSPVNH